MTNILVFSNNASSLLASGISSTATSVTVSAGQGALFPPFTAGQVAMATLEDTSGNLEIVQITGRTGDSMTIIRGQENTSAIGFAAGSRFELRMTAGVASAMLQKNGGDTLQGTLNNNGVIQQGTTGSVQGGEVAGARIRGAPGETDNEIFVPPGGGVPTIGGSKVLTAANILASLPNGVGLNVAGMIFLWSGSSASVPSGYHICDGTNGTPDLRDQFVLGAGGVLPSTGGSSSTTTGSTSLGSLSIGGTSLTVDQLPPHTHQVITGVDTLNGAGAGFAATGVNGSSRVPGPHGTDNAGHTETTGGPAGNMAGNPHTHSISGTTSHAHSYTLPPYKALFYIMKL